MTHPASIEPVHSIALLGAKNYTFAQRAKGQPGNGEQGWFVWSEEAYQDLWVETLESMISALYIWGVLLYFAVSL